MKTAKKVVAAWNLVCPECDEPIDNPVDGSHLWDVGWGSAGTVKCLSCGATVKVPRLTANARGR